MIIVALVILGIEIHSAHATYFNDEITIIPKPIPVNHDQILLLVSNWPFVVQGYPYSFTVKTLDENQITKTTPLTEWEQDQGELQGVQVNAILFNSQGQTLYKWSGLTNQFGWYSGSVLMQNYPVDQNYYVKFTATYPHMHNATNSAQFELVDASTFGKGK